MSLRRRTIYYEHRGLAHPRESALALDTRTYTRRRSATTTATTHTTRHTEQQRRRALSLAHSLALLSHSSSRRSARRPRESRAARGTTTERRRRRRRLLRRRRWRTHARARSHTHLYMHTPRGRAVVYRGEKERARIVKSIRRARGTTRLLPVCLSSSLLAPLALAVSLCLSCARARCTAPPRR